jgi:hypothetical protein
MKRVLIVVILVVAAAVLGLWRSNGTVKQSLSRIVDAADDGSSAVTGDETRKTFELQPGARIEVRGINGKVEIQTSDTKTAEVYVKRTADNPSSLRRREIIIEQTSDGLVVRSSRNHMGLWSHLFGHDPKEEVTINAPRQIAISLKGINGRVKTGDIDGPLEARGISGGVDLGQARESADIAGINGGLTVRLADLGEKGAQINGVNGGIDLKLADGLNATLSAKGMTGGLRSEISTVVIDRDERSRNYSARIGEGGAPIEIKGINGNVVLTRLGNVPVNTATGPKPASDTSREVRSNLKGAQ